MEKKILWVCVVGLLAVDVALLVQRRSLIARIETMHSATLVESFQAKYTSEEEQLVLGTRTVAPTYPGLALEAVDLAGEAVIFSLLVGLDDCTNCIEDELVRLNRLASDGTSGLVAGVSGFVVDEERGKDAERLLGLLTPQPGFPFSIQNVLPMVSQATTPVVLVIRARDGRILDAHKPIPQDLTRRDRFYSRWQSFLGAS